MMLIQNKEENNKGKFFIDLEGEQVAEMDYSLSNGNMTIIHTEVNEKLKGKNVGLLLVNHAAEHARSNHLKIIPVCPFAKKVFEKRREEYIDVLY